MTYNLENGKIIEIKTKSENFIKEKYDANFNITKVAWTNAKVGSILEISYKVTSDFLFNFQDWEFQTTIPTRWSEYRARIPEYYNYEKYMQGYIPLSVNENETKSGSFTITSNQRTGGTGTTAASTSFIQDKIDYLENRFRWAAAEVPAFQKRTFHHYTQGLYFKN